jgi:hypothetical protein
MEWIPLEKLKQNYVVQECTEVKVSGVIWQSKPRFFLSPVKKRAFYIWNVVKCADGHVHFLTPEGGIEAVIIM